MKFLRIRELYSFGFSYMKGTLKSPLNITHALYIKYRTPKFSNNISYSRESKWGGIYNRRIKITWKLTDSFTPVLSTPLNVDLIEDALDSIYVRIDIGTGEFFHTLVFIFDFFFCCDYS